MFLFADLAEYCDFGNTKYEQIRDRIVIGEQDKQLSRRLQLESDLDLAMAIQMTHQSEQESNLRPNATTSRNG